MQLAPEQLQAAAQLWGRLDELRSSDRALAALQGCFPGFDPESTLLKVMALDSVIARRNFDGHALAARIQRLLQSTDLAEAGPDLVDALAATTLEFGKRSYEGLGFASRFANAFIDGERFPILNGWAEHSLQWLLGRPLDGRPGDRRYARFAREFDRVASQLALKRRRELGHWLWLAGQYRAWTRSPRTPIHGAVREQFERKVPELELLLPTRPSVARPGAASPPTQATPAGPLPAAPTPESADHEGVPLRGRRLPGQAL